MPLFLTIFEGPSPLEAKPILATRDPGIIGVVRRLLMERLTEDPVNKLVPLKHPPRRAKKEDYDEQ